MYFNISRQPLVPAFLTLAALTVTAMSCQSPHPGVAASLGTAGPGLAVGTPDLLLARFQEAFPLLSRLIAGLLILFAGMYIGRMTVRYNLYAVSTCIALPLFAVVACGLPTGGEYLSAFTTMFLLAYSVRNYSRSFTNGYSFDAVFRASFYLGLLILVLPTALPLVLMLPLAVLLFQRTIREAVVAMAGLLLPVLGFCYINWGAGGDFAAPLIHTWAEFIARGKLFALFLQVPLPALIALGVVVVLDFFAVMLFFSHIYAVGIKPRYTFVYNIGVLFLGIILLCGPAASANLFALLAIPSAVLMPMVFVRINRVIATPLYLLLLAAALAGIILQ